jgi:hypothetical protein
MYSYGDLVYNLTVLYYDHGEVQRIQYSDVKSLNESRLWEFY